MDLHTLAIYKIPKDKRRQQCLCAVWSYQLRIPYYEILLNKFIYVQTNMNMCVICGNASSHNFHLILHNSHLLIFLGTLGVLKLTDFGFAKETLSKETLQLPGASFIHVFAAVLVFRTQVYWIYIAKGVKDNRVFQSLKRSTEDVNISSVSSRL